jgi:hypothetical protein
MPVQVTESSKPRKSPMSLSHLEIHPKLGGGHIVKHVYSGYDHMPKEYSFNKDGIAKGGEHITDHLMKHAGIGMDEHMEHMESVPEGELDD